MSMVMVMNRQYLSELQSATKRTIGNIIDGESIMS